MRSSYVSRSTAVLAVLWCAGFGVAFGQSNEMYRPVVWGPLMVPSDFVQYSAVFQSSGNAQSHFFLNVVRSDGVWVVQNLPVGFEPGLSQIATNIPASLFNEGDTYHTTFSTTCVQSPPAFNASEAVMHTLGDPVNYLVNGGACRAGYGIFIAPGDAPLVGVMFPPPPPPPFPPYRFVYRKGLPDLDQGPNECAPTSAANSLTWMEDEYDAIDIGMTTAEIRDVLKTAPYMNTSAASGTSDANFVAGKNAFAANYGLPIDTRAIPGGVGTAPGLEELYEELEDGSDVELSIVWLDENGDVAGGHWMSVVGMVEVEGQYGVWLNDPDDGEQQAQFHWIDQNPDGTHSLRGYGGSHRLDLCIAESVSRPSLCAPKNGAIMLAPALLLLAGLARRRPRFSEAVVPA